MVYTIDDIQYNLKSSSDFSFLNKYGKVFTVFDQNDSGNISFGVQGQSGKYFVKIAGAETLESSTTLNLAINNLKNAIPLYTELKYPTLIELVEHYAYNDLYVAVFKWVDGDCLFDHWNFEKYNTTGEKSPYCKFRELPIAEREKAFETICEFLLYIAKKGYVAIDFYDGSIMYDFDKEITTICDIDFFQKQPYINSMGRMWGSSRFQSPEEYEKGSTIDEVTNVFTLGAMAFVLFGASLDRSLEKWEATSKRYKVALRAVSLNREERFQSIEEFITSWNDCV